MFKIGQKYQITMCEPRDNGYVPVIHDNWTIVQVEMPIIMIRNNGEEILINTNSPMFVSAKSQL